MDSQQNVKAELLELGFEENYINQALQITQDKQKIIELIMQYQTECLNPQYLLKNNSRGSSKNIQICVQNMSYPLGEDCHNYVYKMVFLVRMDLKMGVGKIAAQTGHAVLGAYQQLEQTQETESLLSGWEESGCPKIVYKVNSKEQLLELEKKATQQGLNSYVVCDAGKTQVEPGSITVCAIGPGKSELIDKIVGGLQEL
ncbi:peptidyl-tRNA hydrolase, putative [Ichthyophthirius multifiliis]|uniref:peptidyl-tRNA hydrolase n=1 Tax=Ichthyophthirius multifiliis TaxID=5932 RepID=G0R2B5_ICHMU|nr:peptidyl-tRNA hydrolase, putative [Ichthyophthirius multifiliis]EGR28391.1 peptidyl-tRNA hydrolase, putative [Ichthyophthirius multifiliis]|eukprot:XP_004027736.1 peptidyl-tRNA hydrolase, putative [Ichthyophthirius multifiliis]